MVSVGKFIFRGIQKRDAGKFVNDQGKEVKYNECYVLKLDELIEDGKTYERKFKIDSENVDLINRLSNLDLYKPIKMTFDVRLFDTRVSLVPKDLVEEN